LGKLTGYPASMAAQLYAQGKINGTGVLPPEALSGEVLYLFFEEMKRRNIEMLFDENKNLEIFKIPEPYKLG
jgi:saccharopine dehydrogenase-like NADP-dependent oxidoreductase